MDNLYKITAEFGRFHRIPTTSHDGARHYRTPLAPTCGRARVAGAASGPVNGTGGVIVARMGKW
jgi:hypothetical protein